MQQVVLFPQGDRGFYHELPAAHLDRDSPPGQSPAAAPDVLKMLEGSSQYRHALSKGNQIKIRDSELTPEASE